MQAQLNQSFGLIGMLKKEIDDTKIKLAQANIQLTSQNAASTSAPSKLLPKLNQAENLKGAGNESVLRWTTHMSKYLCNVKEPQAMTIAVNYLQGTAHDWWIKYKDTEDGEDTSTSIQLKQPSFKCSIQSIKKNNARDHLAKWKQLKYVKAFTDDFQKIILDIRNMRTEEQIDSYTRGLKPYIWNEICTIEYSKLSDDMRDAERIESAHRRVPASRKGNG